MDGEVVIILDGLKGRFLSEQAEVMDGDRFGEEGMESCFILRLLSAGRRMEGGLGKAESVTLKHAQTAAQNRYED